MCASPVLVSSVSRTRMAPYISPWPRGSSMILKCSTESSALRAGEKEKRLEEVGEKSRRAEEEMKNWCLPLPQVIEPPLSVLPLVQ